MKPPLTKPPSVFGGAEENQTPSRCAKCQAPLRLVALVKNQDTAKRILVAMHLPASVPELHPACPPPAADREARDVEDWLN